jgi:hypothetical protein
MLPSLTVVIESRKNILVYLLPRLAFLYVIGFIELDILLSFYGKLVKQIYCLLERASNTTDLLPAGQLHISSLKPIDRCRHHDLVNSYGISLYQMTTDMFRLT